MSLGPLRLYETPLLEKKGLALFNSASPWASDQQHLRLLYESPHTAALTTRTAVVTEQDVAQATWTSTYPERSGVHGHAFLRDILPTHEGGRFNIARGSLNSYGYSPHSLAHYIEWITELWQSKPSPSNVKPVIISITGPPNAIEGALLHLRTWAAEATKGFATDQAEADLSAFVAVEINLSCPNIKGNSAPSAYDVEAIKEYIHAAQRGNAKDAASNASRLAISLKLPPYTYPAQFDSVIHALEATAGDQGSQQHPITFLTSTNTLGGSFWLNQNGDSLDDLVSSLPSNSSDKEATFDGTGGLAGESLHPIALGNVFTLRNRLDSSSDGRLKNISIIGVGGVASGLSAYRMKAAGAQGVALATALGREGVAAFERVSKEILSVDHDDDDSDVHSHEFFMDE